MLLTLHNAPSSAAVLATLLTGKTTGTSNVATEVLKVVVCPIPAADW